MAEYLTKEEIKQWRSSLEKITLEEFAARLGKQIEEAKKTNDLVDIVLRGKSYTSSSSDISMTRTEKITTIAERAITKERQLTSPKDVSSIIEAPKTVIKPSKKTETKKETPKTVKQEAKGIKKDTKKEIQKPIIENIAKTKTSILDDSQIVFKKALTDREQLVFDYFLKNKNQIVYAKDLAELLNLPRDYVYKYIKNLRAKIEGEKLKNAEAGGFMLTV
ncbi:MAG: helix-turn-helix domain-containing protein [Candidatus Gastranaerophilaceae bacterium]